MKYPFSPDILDAIPEELAELFRGLELQLLEEIARRLKAAGQLNEVTVQDIRALRSHGISLEEIKKAISKATGISRKTLDSLLDDVVERNQKYYRELIDIAKVTEPETLVKKKDIDAIIKQTKDELANITRTIGFVVNNGRTQIKPTQAYKWALDNAAMQIQSGAISYGQAIANATRELADSGLTVINYESGHRDQVDVAVRRAVMTGVNQLNSQYADESLDYLETEYVEVSAHSGARDKDGPLGWENHKKWQGKVYWWKEKSKGNPEFQYPEFEKTCGYGSVTGILGANCRHNYTPFIPDVMERTYTDEELDNIDPPDFEYEGKKYTHYEATQKQREIERTIRKWKRREAAATNPEDKQAAQIRIRRLQQKYKEFSKAANLRTQPERMKAYVPKKKVVDNPAGQDIMKSGAISGALDPASVEAERHAERYYESVRKMTTDVEHISNNTGFSKEEIEGIKSYVFFEKHDLGEDEPMRFFPSYEMAESWQRLIDGKDIQPHDITLINHELMESKLVKAGLTQDEAHIITSGVYNYKKEAVEFYDKIKKRKSGK